MLKKLFLLLSVIPLSAFTLDVNHNSNVYSLSIQLVDSVLAKSNFSYNLISSRDEVMATFTVFYEVLKMNHIPFSTSWKNTYSVNYCIQTELKTNVAYANGFLFLFTEHGNTKIVNNLCTLHFSSSPADLEIIHSTRNGNNFRLGYPSNNYSTVPLQTYTSSMSYYVNQETYFTDSEVSLLGFTVEATKYNVDSSNSVSVITSTGLFDMHDYFTYPNTLENGETFKSFGTLSFATNNLPTYMQITAVSEGVIHEGSIYGECRKENGNQVTVYL